MWGIRRSPKTGESHTNMIAFHEQNTKEAKKNKTKSETLTQTKTQSYLIWKAPTTWLSAEKLSKWLAVYFPLFSYTKQRI